MNKIQEIKNMIESAEAALKNAKRMILELDPGLVSKTPRSAISPVHADSPDGGKIIEGVFNGEKMVDAEGQNYPIPANYASKSKLVAGDHLKLTIMLDGKLMYKQIGPVPRKHIIGTLVQEGSQYKVLANGKGYRVLLASVTYYKASVGDKVSAIIPESDDAEWCTIEALLPKTMGNLNVTDDEPAQEEIVDF